VARSIENPFWNFSVSKAERREGVTLKTGVSRFGKAFGWNEIKIVKKISIQGTSILEPSAKFYN